MKNLARHMNSLQQVEAGGAAAPIKARAMLVELALIVLHCHSLTSTDPLLLPHSHKMYFSRIWFICEFRRKQNTKA